MSYYQLEESRQLLRSFESTAGRFSLNSPQPFSNLVEESHWSLMEKATGRAAEPGQITPGLFDCEMLERIHAHCVLLLPEHADLLRGIAIGACSVLAPNACLLRSPAGCAIAINADLIAYLWVANALLLGLYRAIKKVDKERGSRLLIAYAVLAGTALGNDREQIGDHLFAANPDEYELSKSIVEAQLLFTTLHEIGHLLDRDARHNAHWMNLSESAIQFYSPNHDAEFRADRFAAMRMFGNSADTVITDCVSAFGPGGVFSLNDLAHSVLALFPLFDAMHAWNPDLQVKRKTHPPPLERGRSILDSLRDINSLDSEALEHHFTTLVSLKGMLG